ncbi:MAG: DNA polymerase I [Betaproteobacteria bacterium]|nr:DNA polymerase I [Betaproteobacteria bacterium]
MPLLLLVDGSSYLYRAFHALPDLKNRAGFPTGALKGVLAMLRRLTSDFKADYQAVIFDAKGKTFRHEWYPAYKAHRPSMPEDLALQIPPLHAAIRALGWPLLSIEGVEADDVIGTLAGMAEANGMETLISTGDKDFAQLVTSRTRLVNNNEILDEAGVIAKFGVPPDRITDYLALIGDTTDNIPGVAKCGPKTATRWLAEFGSLDAIIANAAAIHGAVGEHLRAHLDFFPLGRKLVTIDRRVPNIPEPYTLIRQPTDTKALKEIYARHDFKAWQDELADTTEATTEAASATTPPAFEQFCAPSPDLQERGNHAEIARTFVENALIQPPADDGSHRAAYEIVREEADLERWLKKIAAATRVALDTETTGLDPLAARLVGISLAVAPGDACYIPLAHRGLDAFQLPFAATIARLKPWLESTSPQKIGQNLKYDRHVLANHGILLAGVADDTLLQSYVLESDKGHDLEQLARRHLGLTGISYSDVCGKGTKAISFADVAIERAAVYAAEDADLAYRLSSAMLPAIEANAGLARIYRDIELPLCEVLFKMERAGVLIDAGQLNAQSHDLGRRILALEEEAQRLAGEPFSLASTRQLAEILFVRHGLPIKKKTPGGIPSTDEEALAELALDFPLPKLILAWRALSKLKNTYTDKLPRMINPGTGRVHTHFSQATAVTGRLSSSEPNLQNIPARDEEGRRIRAAFIAPDNCRIISADYSQIELRIMAHLSEDKGLLDAFSQGEDVHKRTAADIFGLPPEEIGADQRRVAKTINFGLIYGMSAFGLAKGLGISRSEAQGYIERYFARYPGVARYMEETRARARQDGFVETVFGRRLAVADIASPVRRQAAERAAINAPMQGTAADLIKLAMLAVQNWLETERMRSRLILQVHDELVLEVPKAELALIRARLPNLMESVGTLKVPLVVDIGEGDNWEAAH